MMSAGAARFHISASVWPRTQPAIRPRSPTSTPSSSARSGISALFGADRRWSSSIKVTRSHAHPQVAYGHRRPEVGWPVAWRALLVTYEGG